MKKQELLKNKAPSPSLTAAATEEIKMQNSNQVIKREEYIPEHRKVFGKTLSEVKNAVLKRVKRYFIPK